MNQPSFQSIEDELDGLPRLGDVLLGKYRVDGVLGVGGMAAVLAATHLALRERVAIKMLLPEWSGNREVAARFLNEGRAAARIRGEHVVRVIDVDEVDGRPFLVLEYLDGMDLAAVLASQGPLSVEDSVEFVLQACEAMAEAHRAGIVHRDLKPANLFLCHRADGSACVKVLDFGISKVGSGTLRDSGLRSVGTMPTAIMGSPHYMSPEQMMSSTSVDARADIWSLGTILHEFLAGVPPFEGETIPALCAQILREPPPDLTRLRADVPEALAQVVLRCLAKEPSERFADVAEVARALAPFGPSTAEVSADRIGRVYEGRSGDAVSSRPPALGRTSVRAPEICAAEILEGDPPLPLRRPVAGYVSLALVLFSFAAGIGWKAAYQVRISRNAARENLVAAAPPTIPREPPVATPAFTTTSAVATTAVLVPASAPAVTSPPMTVTPPAPPAPASSTSPSPAPVEASAPTANAASKPIHPASTPPTPHHHRAPARTGQPTAAASEPATENPYDPAESTAPHLSRDDLRD